MSITIPPQNGFNVIGSSSQVIGNLNAGDYTSATFQIAQTGRSDIKVMIQYTDATGVRRSLEKKLPVKLSGSMTGGTSENDMEAMHGGDKSNISKQAAGFAPYLGIVVLGIIGIWQRKGIKEMYKRLKFQRLRNR